MCPNIGNVALPQYSGILRPLDNKFPAPLAAAPKQCIEHVEAVRRIALIGLLPGHCGE